MKEVKCIALIAHDNKKAEMVSWAMKNRDTLARFELCGTGTTSKLVAEATGLDVHRYLSGPAATSRSAPRSRKGRSTSSSFSGILSKPSPTTPTSKRCSGSRWSTTSPSRRIKPLPTM